jgi:DNA-binding GntR family transcriptional regulator
MTVTEPTKVARPTLAHQVREALIARILSGDVKPGERLVETRIAATYGTSQAPVREALRDLEAMRLVETRPRRGTFVRHLVEETLREAYVVRAALEETATRLVMLRGDLPLEALGAEVAAMWAAARSGDTEASLGASVAFHRHVLEATDNDLLVQSWEGLRIEARTDATIIAADLDLEEIARDHEELLATLTLGDLEDACRHSREHQWRYAGLPHDASGRAASRRAAAACG